MLVTFRTKAFSNITMFGGDAVQLLKLMGQTGAVPGAILGDDVPAALARLKQGLAAVPKPAAPPVAEGDEEEDEKEEPVPLARHAFPLVELLTAAAAARADVMWDQ